MLIHKIQDAKQKMTAKTGYKRQAHSPKENKPARQYFRTCVFTRAAKGSAQQRLCWCTV